MKTEAELFENALDTTSVNGKKLREYINENYISNSVLDEIRAEIEEHAKINYALNVDRANALCWCLDVIDKYKVESEEQE
jgi:hypothetical protein